MAIPLHLLIPLLGLPCVKPILSEGAGIHHRDDSLDLCSERHGHGALQTDCPILLHGLGLTNTAELDDNVLEDILLRTHDDVLHSGEEVVCRGAADTTILKFSNLHQALLVAANELRIDVYCSDIVDHYTDPHAILVFKQVLQQCCLSSAKETTDKGNRRLRFAFKQLRSVLLPEVECQWHRFATWNPSCAHPLATTKAPP
mmetsp:Transcript_86962/g.225919  ORF Transcript_86962/g.225919 Transcript_86962/m.225919 type:complete len:201 (+) Transcript_86962:1512-2114(+)